MNKSFIGFSLNVCRQAFVSRNRRRFLSTPIYGRRYNFIQFATSNRCFRFDFINFRGVSVLRYFFLFQPICYRRFFVVRFTRGSLRVCQRRSLSKRRLSSLRERIINGRATRISGPYVNVFRAFRNREIYFYHSALYAFILVFSVGVLRASKVYTIRNFSKGAFFPGIFRGTRIDVDRDYCR